MYDAVHLFAKALHDLDTSQQIDIKPLSCESTDTWPHGYSLINYMKIVSIYFQLCPASVYILYPSNNNNNNNHPSYFVLHILHPYRTLHIPSHLTSRILDPTSHTLYSKYHCILSPICVSHILHSTSHIPYHFTYLTISHSTFHYFL